MRRKVLALALIGSAALAALLVERRTRPELVDEYAD